MKVYTISPLMAVINKGTTDIGFTTTNQLCFARYMSGRYDGILINSTKAI